MSVNVSNGCTFSDQRLFQSHSPDSPLEERSDGDLDCDLFFFLWYSSSSDSEPWKHKAVHTWTTRDAEQSYATRGGFPDQIIQHKPIESEIASCDVSWIFSSASLSLSGDAGIHAATRWKQGLLHIIFITKTKK